MRSSENLSVITRPHSSSRTTVIEGCAVALEPIQSLAWPATPQGPRKPWERCCGERRRLGWLCLTARIVVPTSDEDRLSVFIVNAVEEHHRKTEGPLWLAALGALVVKSEEVRLPEGVQLSRFIENNLADKLQLLRDERDPSLRSPHHLAREAVHHPAGADQHGQGEEDLGHERCHAGSE